MTHTKEIFLQHLIENKKAAQNTVLSYERDLRHFSDFLASCAITKIDRVNKTNIMVFMLHLQKNGKKTATINRHMATLHTYFQFLFYQGLIPSDPTFTMHTMDKVVKAAPVTLNESELYLFLSQPDLTTLKGARDHAMFTLLCGSPVKTKEVLALHLHDIHVALGYMSCGTDLNGRIVPLNKHTATVLTEYMDTTRPQLLLPNSSTTVVFLNMQGEPITRQGFWKIVSTYGKQANIGKTVTPHMLQQTSQVLT